MQCLQETKERPSPACKYRLSAVVCASHSLSRGDVVPVTEAPRAEICWGRGRGRKTEARRRDDRNAQLGLVPTRSRPPSGTTSLRPRPPPNRLPHLCRPGSACCSRLPKINPEPASPAGHRLSASSLAVQSGPEFCSRMGLK